MHDLDRVQAEFGMSNEQFDMDSSELEFDLESEGVYGDISEEAVFDEGEEMELAAELLDVSSERELDEFLGKWIRKQTGRARGLLKTGTGRMLGGVLKGAIKKVLPGVAGAAANLVAPGLGGVLGPKAAAAAGSLLGLELEGLSPEDQEFEAARQIVRLGTAAMENAADASESESPRDIAMRAFSDAAKRYAPGFLGGAAQMVGGGRRSGSWRRVGNRIILEGV